MKINQETLENNSIHNYIPHNYSVKMEFKCSFSRIPLNRSKNKDIVQPISGCVRIACSQNKLLSPCYKVDEGNRLATSFSNKTNTGCS